MDGLPALAKFPALLKALLPPKAIAAAVLLMPPKLGCTVDKGAWLEAEAGEPGDPLFGDGLRCAPGLVCTDTLNPRVRA